jgi:superfamily I DNA and RNA helicase
MALETVVGPKRDVLGVDALIRMLSSQQWSGTLYVGYPVLSLPDGPRAVDALLTCEEHGVVAFDVYEAGSPQTVEAVRERQDELFAALYSGLLTSKHLVNNRQLSVQLNIVTVVAPGSPVAQEVRGDAEEAIAVPEDVVRVVERFQRISEDQLRKVSSAVQRMGGVRVSKRRTGVSREDSRGAIMQQIDREIANLDQWQKAAAIETPDGPQRIRGLAGSGKTVVLAFKAAYLHARQPEWRVALTFHTRTLYQQLRALVRQFYYEQTREEPNWNNLRILHTWGAQEQDGFYRTVADQYGIEFLDFNAARAKFSRERAFEGACKKAVDDLGAGEIEPLHDVVLIDEAQDLPASFFELTYKVTAPPKRVVWAYDDLQNIGDYVMAPPATLFGSDATGEPRVPSLNNDAGRPKQDIILPVCYRNTPWALTVAHAIGFGVYRSKGLVQFFDDAAFWREIGYEEVAGEVTPGEAVALARLPKASPQYFPRLLDPADAVSYHVFDDVSTQATWVATEIEKNLRLDELTPRDILVIVVPPFEIQQDSLRLVQALHSRKVPAHIVGHNTSRDKLFDEAGASIAIASVLRAKGNEAPVVYLLNAEFGVRSGHPVKGRNSLFTAITRSRAWVRICGVGPAMQTLKYEIDQVVKNRYELRLTVPTADQLRRIRKIHRDMTSDQRARVRTAKQGIAAVLELAEDDSTLLEALLESFPEETRERLMDSLRSAVDGRDET